METEHGVITYSPPYPPGSAGPPLTRAPKAEPQALCVAKTRCECYI